MEDFIKNYGTLIIAIYGVVQVWIMGIWNRYFRKGTLEIHKTSKLEVGYSNFGPTIALNGTLRAKNKNIFVSNAQITIRRMSDNSTRIFNWTAFRSPQIKIGKTEPITLEMPSGFIVNIDSPYRFHIFFSDYDTQKELEPYLIKVNNAWTTFLNDKKEELTKASSEKDTNINNYIEYLFNSEFIKTEVTFNEAFDILNRKVYWEPGEYEADLIFTSDAKGTSVKDIWKFKITKDDFEKLRLNSISTLSELCLGSINYNFIYPEYEKD